MCIDIEAFIKLYPTHSREIDKMLQDIKRLKQASIQLYQAKSSTELMNDRKHFIIRIYKQLIRLNSECYKIYGIRFINKIINFKEGDAVLSLIEEFDNKLMEISKTI